MSIFIYEKSGSVRAQTGFAIKSFLNASSHCVVFILEFYVMRVTADGHRSELNAYCGCWPCVS